MVNKQVSEDIENAYLDLKKNTSLVCMFFEVSFCDRSTDGRTGGQIDHYVSHCLQKGDTNIIHIFSYHPRKAKYMYMFRLFVHLL